MRCCFLPFYKSPSSFSGAVSITGRDERKGGLEFVTTCYVNALIVGEPKETAVSPEFCGLFRLLRHNQATVIYGNASK